jgi:segregation and condensation protein B
MSLKAKLEAVIYAAEEPVTLTQLAALFASDALEWKAQQEAAAAEQTAEVAAGEGPDADFPLLQEGLENIGLSPDEPEDADITGNAGEPPVEAPAPVAELSVPDTTETPAAEAAETPAEPLDPEAEARREARAREREVKNILKQLLDELVAEYARDSRGLEIREIAGGYRMATKPEVHDAVRLFVKSLKPPMKLSLPALETLAVVAYKQPVTAPEVSEIRGVETGGVLGSLLARKLVATAGRKQVIGRPMLYKTTKEFLLRFGLKDVNELPSMDEFEKMAAAEIDEMEPAQAEAEAAEGEAVLLAAEAGESESEPGAEGQNAAPVKEEVAAAMASQDEWPKTAEMAAKSLERNPSSSTGLADTAEVTTSEVPEHKPAAAEESASESRTDAEPGEDQAEDSPEADATAAVEAASPADGELTAAEIEASKNAQEEKER